MDLPEDRAPVPHAHQIVPTDATCYIFLFENELVGLKPYASFSVNIDCQEVTPDVPCEDFDGNVSIDISGIPLGGNSWRSIYEIDLKNVECSMQIGGPEISVYFNQIHHRMGTLTMKVMSHDGDMVRIYIRASEDIDCLGLDEFELEFNAKFEGVDRSTALDESGTKASDLIHLDGLTQKKSNFWTLPDSRTK